MNGTFSVVPKGLLQLYTIHVKISTNKNPTIKPLVYALMSNKTESSYESLFNFIKHSAERRGHPIAPKYIITDFERSAIKASKKVFYRFSHRCCYFHLS